MAPTREFTSEQVMSAHVAFLRLMVEAMSPATLPARSEPIHIAAETAAVRLALMVFLGASAPPVLAAVNLAVERIHTARRPGHLAFARAVQKDQGRILNRKPPAETRARPADPTVELVALWTVVAAVVATGTSEDRLRTAKATAERALAAVGREADDATHLSMRAQADFYESCLEAFAGVSSAPVLH